MNSDRTFWLLPAAAFLIVMSPGAAWTQIPQTTTGATAEGSVEQYIQQCVDLYNKHDLAAALKECDQAVSIDPDSWLAYYDRGVVRYASQDFAGALRDYNEAVNVKPNERNVLFARGVVRYQLGDKAGAMTDYDRSIHLRIEDPTAYLDRGVLRTDNGDWPGAEKDFAHAIKKRPDFTNAYVNRAAERRKSGDAEGANEDYTKALSLDPGDASGFYNRGALRFERGELDGAIDDYGNSIRLNDKDERVFYDRGVAYKKERKFEEAIGDFRTSVGLKPSDAKAFFSLAASEYDREQFQKAVDDYSQAITLTQRKWPEALYGRGLAYERQGDLDKAIQDYSAALELAPNGAGQAGIYFNRGLALQRRYDLDRKDRELLAKAIRDYHAAIEHGLTTPEVYYNLGFACQQADRTDEAMANYDLAIKARPNYLEALRQRGEQFNIKGEWDAAIRDLEEAKSLRPDDPNVFDALGRAHYGKGEFDRAAEDYLHEIEIRAKADRGQEAERRATAEAYVGRGAARYKAKDLNGAIEDYTKATEVKKDYVLAYCDLNAAYLNSGQMDKAEESREAANRISPDEAKQFCKGEVVSQSDTAGRREYQQGHFQQAVQKYKEAIQHNAGDPGAHYGLAVSLYGSDPKDLPGAIAEYTAAIRLKSDYVEAYNGRGLAYRASGNITEAEQDFRKATELRPDLATALLNLAEARAAQKQWGDALIYYNKSTALRPQDATAWEGSGLAHYKTDDLDGAIADYTKAIGIRNKSVQAFLGRGDAYAKQEKWEQAQADYDKAFENYNASAESKEKNPGVLAGILLDRGVVRYEIGDKAGAKEDYSKALHLNPKNEPGYYDRSYLALMENRLSTALADSGRAVSLSQGSDADALDIEGIAQGDAKKLRAALATFDKAIALKPNDTSLLFNRALVLFRLNEFDKAIADYNSIIQQHARDAEAFYRRGIAHGAKGDFPAALADYTEAIRLRPNFASAYANRWDLYLAMGEEEKAKADLEQAKRLRAASDSKPAPPSYR